MNLLPGIVLMYESMPSLQLETSRWNRNLKAAIARAENRERSKKGLPKTSLTAWLPEGPEANLYLLNLKVWSVRYHISLDFILDTLFFCWRYRRKQPNANCATLGLPAALIGGPVSRKYVEEAVCRTYPNGENMRSCKQPRPSAPLRSEEFTSLDDFLRRYGKVMTQRQKEFSGKLSERSSRAFRR